MYYPGERTVQIGPGEQELQPKWPRKAQYTGPCGSHQILIWAIRASEPCSWAMFEVPSSAPRPHLGAFERFFAKKSPLGVFSRGWCWPQFLPVLGNFWISLVSPLGATSLNIFDIYCSFPPKSLFLKTGAYPRNARWFCNPANGDFWAVLQKSYMHAWNLRCELVLINTRWPLFG